MKEPCVLDPLDHQERGLGLRPGYVPQSMLFGFVGDEVAGRVGLRHHLTEALERLGGHIGYMVIPQFRRRGVATSLLRQTLPLARQIGISRVLVTCSDDNIGSYKAIENCGGALADVEVFEGVKKRRYWIELK